MSFLLRQASDLVAYLLLPLAALFLPASASRALAVHAARWQWLLGTQCREARARATEQGAVTDAEAWAVRWRLVELLEARDLFLLSFGRAGSVLGEIEGREALQAARGSVFVGMHWGPSIALLRVLADHGLEPAFIYRPVERGLLRARPFQYLLLRLAVREIRRACAGREIPIGGAAERLRRRLAGSGSEVVLMDAPPLAGRSALEAEVLGSPARFSAGFPGLVVESGKPFVFYALGLGSADDGVRRLEVTTPGRALAAQQFVGEFASWLDRHLRNDPAQWRLWPAAGQFFLPAHAAAADAGPEDPCRSAPRSAAAG